jgi:DNA-binding CsgD family transcriptional regulator
MKAPVTISERDLHALLGIVSDGQQEDLPATGLPWSVLSGLQEQVRCDAMVVIGHVTSPPAEPLLEPEGGIGSRPLPRQPDDQGELCLMHYEEAGSQVLVFQQGFPATPDYCGDEEECWECPACSYPNRTGDLRSVIKLSDFYSSRQLHSTNMYGASMRRTGHEHELMVSLPNDRARLWFYRGPGPDFSERDRGLLALLRPHLYEVYVDAERRRQRRPQLTRRHWDLLNLVAAGHTNAQIARRLDISEGTVRKHMENIYSRLQVSSRAAAVTRAFSDPSAVTMPGHGDGGGGGAPGGRVRGRGQQRREPVVR